MAVINTNITSMIAQQNLNSSKGDLTTAMERLSSGLRINSAKDDAAGQAIANRMSSQITGLSQAQRNANDGISVAQTTEGALNQVNDNLQRIRELSVQAQNGTNSDDDLASIQNEIGQRLNEINRISEETSFNGTNVLASDQNLSIQVGANDGESISISLKQINRDTLNLAGFNVDGSGETDNTVATKDSLTLAGAAQTGTTNEYVLSTQNDDATTSQMLSNVTTENSSVAISGGATYTINAEGNFVQSQSFTNGSGPEAIADAMTPSTAGEVVEADATIGGQTTRISIASDGSITSADSGNALYLDDTGNLTENGAGTPPAATISNFSESLTTTANSSITFDNGTKFTTGAINANAITDGDNGISAGGLETAVRALATDDTAANRGELSVTIDGTTSSVFVDDSGNLWQNKTGNASGDQFTIGGSSTQATASDLDGLVAGGNASATIAAAGNGVSTDVGKTYTVNRDVALSGKEVTSADVNDAINAAAGGSITMDIKVEDSDGTVLGTQGVTFTGVADADKTMTFSGGASLLGTDGEAVKISADDGELTSDDTTDVSYFAQANGNVTNDSGQRVYEDGEGGFTTEATTAGDRTENPLGVLDSALSQVDALRSDLGAIQNRFESAITNLATTETNLSAARSRIEDADYATEVANMTRGQILQQAGTSVLAQANQLPQSVLSLLG